MVFMLNAKRVDESFILNNGLFMANSVMICKLFDLIKIRSQSNSRILNKVSYKQRAYLEHQPSLNNHTLGISLPAMIKVTWPKLKHTAAVKFLNM